MLKLPSIDGTLTCLDYENNILHTLNRENHIGKQDALETLNNLDIAVTTLPTIQQIINDLESLTELFSTFQNDLLGDGELAQTLETIRQIVSSFRADLEYYLENSSLISNLQNCCNVNTNLISSLSASVSRLQADLIEALSTLTDLSSSLSLKANINSPTLTGSPLAPTAAKGTNTTQLATTAYVLTNSAPIGSWLGYLGTSDPIGYPYWMVANGRELLVSDYPELFQFLGSIYSNSPTNTRFRIPDLRNRYAKFQDTSVRNTGGANSKLIGVTNLPSHSHTINNSTVNNTGLNDGGEHTHTVNDPGHSHRLDILDVAFFGYPEGVDGVQPGGAGSRNDPQFYGTRWSNPASTNISINPASSSAHTHLIPAHSHTAENTGGGQAFNVEPAHFISNILIKVK
jgi:hypothetical protein